MWGIHLRRAMSQCGVSILTIIYAVLVSHCRHSHCNYILHKCLQYVKTKATVSSEFFNVGSVESKGERELIYSVGLEPGTTS